MIRITSARLRVFLLQMAVVLAFFLVLEVVARGWYAARWRIPFFETSGEDLSRIYDYNHPYLPVVLRKHSRLLRPGAEVSINNVGFRGPDVSRVKEPGTIRVVTLGGSTTWGNALPERHAWPRVLEGNLRALFPERKIEVINAGVPGYNSMENLISLETRVLPLGPDIITVYDGYNDMKATFRGKTFEPDYSDWRSRKNPHGRTEEIIRDYSRVAFAVYRVMLRVAPPKKVFGSSLAFADHGQVTSFKRNLFNMVSLARAHGVVPVLGTVNLALATRFHDAEMSPFMAVPEIGVMLKAYNQQIFDLAAENHLDVADVESKVPDDETIHNDMCHLTVEGNRQVAQVFTDAIAPVIRRRDARQ